MSRAKRFFTRPLLSRNEPVVHTRVVPERPPENLILSAAQKILELNIQVKPVPKPEEDEEPIVVAVMGVTGVGKSSFIKLVSGRDDVKIGDTLSSETTEIYAYEFYHEGRFYILVDTPGFDDTNRPDTEITNKILQWLKETLLAGQRLNGVIYLHRISDTRMGGTALRNNRMFRKLVGDQAFSSVILATTFWEQVPHSTATKREAELREKKDFWGAMIEKGARMDRLTRDRATALRILEQISQKDKVVFQAQDELVNQGKTIEDTAAAQETRAEIDRLKRELEARQAAERRRIERDMNADRMRRADAIEQERLRMEKKMRDTAQAEASRRERQETENRRRLDAARLELEAERERQRLRRQEELNAARRLQEEEEQRRYLRRRELAELYDQEYECLEHEPDAICDGCDDLIGRYSVYYHCCFCLYDRFVHCWDCGGDCGEASHPYMIERDTPSGHVALADGSESVHEEHSQSELNSTTGTDGESVQTDSGELESGDEGSNSDGSDIPSSVASTDLNSNDSDDANSSDDVNGSDDGSDLGSIDVNLYDSDDGSPVLDDSDDSDDSD